MPGNRASKTGADLDRMNQICPEALSNVKHKNALKQPARIKKFTCDRAKCLS